MDLSFINVSNTMHGLAMQALDRGDVDEGYRLLEMSLVSTMMTKCSLPLSFRFVPRRGMPFPTVSPEHVVIRLSRQGIEIFAWAEFVTKPVFSFERFPIVGDLFARVAAALPEDGRFCCVFDLGDGDDVGDYARAAFCSARPGTVLIPDPYIYYNDNYDTFRAQMAQSGKPWDDRRDQVFWRGGGGCKKLNEPDPASPLDWSSRQRLHLCAAVRDSAHGDFLDVGVTHLRTVHEDYLKEAVIAAGFLKPVVDKSVFNEYRYQLDIDGWTNAWSLLDKMISGAAIIKVASVAGYRQWFYDKLVPWTHYIPVKADLSDFDQVIGWVRGHESECRNIAAASAALAQTVQLEAGLEQAKRGILDILRPF
ncbi:MAG TPA: glycosyl transferase family 90 [Candidatus Sulfotelmatobacter sp.]|jgi:hypothetical protein|nr:glycosyl transferase family 90 [Candidatus Sulfotelmatobacter sp.]